MNTTIAALAGALLLVAATGAPASAVRLSRGSLPAGGSPDAIQLADMGMGELGPELGGSQNDMVLDDPGKLPREPDMVVDDPGKLPREPDMVLDNPGRLPPEPDMIVSDPGRLPPQPQMDIEQPQDLDAEDDID